MKLPHNVHVSDDYTVLVTGGDCVLLKVQQIFSPTARTFRLRYVDNIETEERPFVVPNSIENIVACLKERDINNPRITIRDNKSNHLYSLSEFLSFHSGT